MITCVQYTSTVQCWIITGILCCVHNIFYTEYVQYSTPCLWRSIYLYCTSTSTRYRVQYSTCTVKSRTTSTSTRSSTCMDTDYCTNYRLLVVRLQTGTSTSTVHAWCLCTFLTILKIVRNRGRKTIFFLTSSTSTVPVYCMLVRSTKEGITYA